ncbi:MAG: hypothetical protein ACR2HP_17685, partial [Ilumatobacteraceae bacterium]
MTTLAELLYGDLEHATRDLRKRAPALLVASSATALGVTVPAMQLATTIATLLDMSVGDLAVHAWEQQGRVSVACQQTRGHPESRQVVRLLEHTISSTQHPTVDVEAGPIHGTLLTLTVHVEIAVNPTEFVVERGRIVDVRPGTAAAEATLSVGDVVLARRKTRRFDLPFERWRRAA